MDQSLDMKGSGLFDKAKGLAAKAKDKVKGARDKAASAALMSSLGSLNPFGKKKGLPGLGSLGALTKDMTGLASAKGPAAPGSKLTLLFKILVFAITTLFISLFVVYTIKKTQGFSKENIIKVVFVALIFNLALSGAFMFKIPILDFLISSQINILCFYMILTYSTLTT